MCWNVQWSFERFSFQRQRKMKTSKSTGWPSKVIWGIAILNFILQLSCIPFFPATAPCHWTAQGIANGYMSKYFFILYDLLPFLILWIFSRTPSNQLVNYFYNLPQGQIVRTIILILAILATWIPVYMILFVPTIIPVNQQTTWTAGMVYAVEAVAGVAIILILLTCIITWIKLRPRH